jgi:hypothetical protein
MYAIRTSWPNSFRFMKLTGYGYTISSRLIEIGPHDVGGDAGGRCWARAGAAAKTNASSAPESAAVESRDLMAIVMLLYRYQDERFRPSM